MSDPTYRIDVDHSPASDEPWGAYIVRLSDDRAIGYRTGPTAEDVVEQATEYVAATTQKQNGFSLYVDDDGRPVEGHSVKAS